MGREWSTDRELNQAKAEKALRDAVQRLRSAGKNADADKVQAAMEKDKRRDLVIETRWSDLADLDLEVTEPTGAICGPRQPQSTGGGLWRGDQFLAEDRAEKFHEIYSAAEAFSGSYEVRVKKVWGQPLGDKVTVTVTRHQGTPEQTQELHRLTIGSDGVAYLKLNLDGGRRTGLASVPPPAPRKPAKAATVRGRDQMFLALQKMSEPAYAGMSKQAMMGGGAATGPSAMQMFDTPTESAGPEVAYQNRLTTGDLHAGTEMMGQAVVASDRSKITVHVSPVFQTATDHPEVKLSTIPGGQ
jgi:hypothetical protein